MGKSQHITRITANCCQLFLHPWLMLLLAQLAMQLARGVLVLLASTGALGHWEREEREARR